MPFLFQWLCELLEDLDSKHRSRCLTTPRPGDREGQILEVWYKRHNHRIERTGPAAVAFLSCLLPEHRPDRVIGLQATRLSQIFGRALGLGASRVTELNQWRERDGADFATCIEKTLQQCENDSPAPGKEVTLEEIDEALELIAANCPASSPAIRARRTLLSPSELLSPILRRLKSSEAKWFVRMIRKCYAPVEIPEHKALHGFHFMLPDLLRIQNSFQAAVTVFDKPVIRNLPSRPDKHYEAALRTLVAEHVQPRVGVMIRRQPYHKARSIKNCCAIAGEIQMSVERKYDGEYCQIHIDMAKGDDCVQIFSKSGKDSTQDRARLHGAIKDALMVDRDGCKIRMRCVVEGELLVSSSSKRQILPFYRIRRYVKHGGRDIGTDQDSPARPDENLMIAFYDILLLDERMLLNEPHKVRRQYLKAVVQNIEGRAILGERHVIDFMRKDANTKLRSLFSRAVSLRWEGLVLKPSDEPYFSWHHQNHGIKLKKDYITGLGDTADLCIIGGHRDPDAELRIGLGRLRYTIFYLGAVCNKDQIRRYDAIPEMKVIDVLTHHSMSRTDFLDLNKLGQLVQVDHDSSSVDFKFELGCAGMNKPTELFRRPIVVEIMGAGFQKLPNSNFFTLRFPRMTNRNVKLHTDRSLSDTTSFCELQEMAERSMTVPQSTDSQEDAIWINRLLRADGQNHTSVDTSRESSCCKTLVSPSSIILSPAASNREARGRTFVRPDTEELGSQSTDICAEETISAPGPAIDSSIPEQLSRTPLAEGSAFQNSRSDARKRKLANLWVPNNEEPSRSTYYLDAKRVLAYNHKLPVNRTGSSQVLRLTIDDNNKTLTQKWQKVYPTAGTSFQKPVDLQAEMSSSEVTTNPVKAGSFYGDGASTPDSVMVMKQILSVSYCADKCQMAPREVEGLRFAQSQDAPAATNRTLIDYSISSLSSRSMSLIDPLPVQNVAVKVFSRNETADVVVNHMSERHQPLVSPSVIYQKEQISHATAPSKKKKMMMITTANKQALTHLSTTQISKLLPVASLIFLLNTHHSIQDSLSALGVPLTFSSKFFCSQIEAAVKSNESTTGNLHNQRFLILTDVHNPESTADAFVSMAYEIQSRLTSVNDAEIEIALDQYNQRRILVFDQRVLRHVGTAHKDRIDVGVCPKLGFEDGRGKDAALFCGLVRFYHRRHGRHQHRHLKRRHHVGLTIDDSGVDGSTNGDEKVLRVGIRLIYDLSWMR